MSQLLVYLCPLDGVLLIEVLVCLTHYTQWDQEKCPLNGGVHITVCPLQLVLVYYNVLEWENRFTLGLNTAKSADCIEKCFKQKLYKIKFPTKNLVVACVYLHQ